MTALEGFEADGLALKLWIYRLQNEFYFEQGLFGLAFAAAFSAVTQHARRDLVLGKLGLMIHFARAELELNLGAERLVRLDDFVEIGIQAGDLGMGQGKGLQQVGHGMAAL